MLSEKLNTADKIIAVIYFTISIVALVFVRPWLNAVFYIAVFTVLAYISHTDITERKIRNWSVLIFLGFALVSIFFFDIPIWQRIIDTGIVALAFICALIVVKNGAGMGDFKMFLVAAFMFGNYIIMVSLLSFIPQLVYAVIFKKKHPEKKGLRIPAGPFFSAGITVTMFYIAFSQTILS